MRATPGNRILQGLSGAANRLVAENAQTLRRLAGAGLTLEQRAQRPWDIPAKIEIAEQIADEELRRAGPFAHNNTDDAQRHARWSQRTAQAAGPIFAEAAGIAHEAQNVFDSVRAHGVSGPYEPQDRGPARPRLPPTPGETIDESRMDLRNNAEGRRAALERRQIDPGRLQTAPRTPVVSVLYRHPPAGRTFSGHP